MRIDSVTTLQTVAGGAILKQEGTIFMSDSAVLNPITHIIEAFGNIHINQGDTLHTYGEYLRYLGVEKMAYLKKNVKLTDGKGTLFTQDMDYNLETGIGNFYQGGKVIEKNNVITSLEGRYYADTKDVYFKKNVEVKGPKDTITADSLLYNMQTKKSFFISQTHIKNAEVDINTTEGSYDLNSGDAFFTKRTTVTDSSGRIYSADNMALDGVSGNGQLEGNAVIIDSANSFVVIANQIFLNKKNNSFLATRKPLLIVQQKNDSTYIAADTIFSGLKGSEMILKEDTIKNINLQQDEKIGDLIATDSENPRDSANMARDSLLFINDSISRLNNPLSLPTLRNDSLHPDTLRPDTLPLKLPPKLSDSTRDIPRNNLLEKAIPDTTPVLKKRGDSMVLKTTPDTLALATPDSLQVTPGLDSTRMVMPGTTLSLMNASKDSLDKSDTIRYFLAFHNVRIFNDSLQSVCDSMFFSTEDSVFRLYKDPVIWNGQSQITGDTVYLFTKNKEPERLYVFEKGMIVNRTKEGFFNQVAGKTINAYFLNGKIDYARVRGQQSESIYYMQDEDSAYIAMNRATGDVIDFYFKKEELIKVLFVNDIDGNMFPMNEIPQEQRELKNFQWLDQRRPKTKFELY